MRRGCLTLIAVSILLFGSVRAIQAQTVGSPFYIQTTGYTWGIAYDSANHLVYVADSYGYILVYDPSTLALVRNITLGPDPGGMVPSLTEMVYSNVTGLIYVADTNLPGLWALDPDNGHIIGNVTLSHASQPSRIAELSSTLYISSSTTNSVYAVDTSTLDLVANVSVGDGPVGLAVDPLNSRLYVACHDSNSTYVVDTMANVVVKTIATPGGPLAALYLPGGMVYVSENLADSVAVIDPTSDTVNTTVVVASPYGLNLWALASVPGPQVWVADSAGGSGASITQIDPATSAVIGRVNNIQFVMAMAYDPLVRTVFATSREATWGVVGIPLLGGTTTTSTTTVMSSITSSTTATSTSFPSTTTAIGPFTSTGTESTSAASSTASTSPSTTSSTSSSSTPSTASSGGIPEFPVLGIAALTASIVVVLSYLLSRRHLRP
jgi:YVTN family beta-propeller protein